MHYIQQAAAKIEEIVPDSAFSTLCAASDSDHDGYVTLAEYHLYLTKLHQRSEIPTSVLQPQLQKFQAVFDRLEKVNFVPGTCDNISKFISLFDTVRIQTV